MQVYPMLKKATSVANSASEIAPIIFLVVKIRIFVFVNIIGSSHVGFSDLLLFSGLSRT